ncbi:MAG: hypothetical protein U9R44_02800 [Candidatus Omnitrophota bacterium]|nr:hypothetical protein [Candidatus Omnitrophota bacterium]
MVKKAVIFFLAWIILFGATGAFSAEEEIHFDFEKENPGWVIPDWAYEQPDHVARFVSASSKEASSGSNSLEIMCEYPGDEWKAALVEREGDLDFTGYETISMDVYLPKTAPKHLFLGRIILTVSEGWLFTQMKEGVPLYPGKWTTVSARLDFPEQDYKKSAWRGRKEKRLYKHLSKIKKVAIRIEYDAAPPYRIGKKHHGPVYVDNMVIK